MNETKNNKQVLRGLWRLIGPLKIFILLASILGFLSNIAATFISIFSTYAFLSVLNFEMMFSLKFLFVSIIAFALMRGVLRYGEQAMNHFVAFKVLAHIRSRIFNHLRLLAPAKLETRHKGDLISMITTDIELLEVFYAHTLSPVLIATFMTLLMVVFIGQYHILLGLTALMSYLIIGLGIPLMLSDKSRIIADHFRKKSSDFSSYVVENARGIGKIIQYNHQDRRFKVMTSALESLSRNELESKKVNAKNMTWINTAIYLATLVMLIVSLLLYQDGAIGFDGVVVSVIALMSSFGPVVAVANLGAGLSATLAAGNRILELLDESPEVEPCINGIDTVFMGAEYEQVAFAYDEKPILSNINLNIEKNKILGIQGASGSGKSTMIKLLMRFWDVDEGSVNLSGINIKTINTRSLRNFQSYVTQETYLFHDTVANNIKIAKKDATENEVIRAAQKASVHKAIMQLPNGYNTCIGELGDTLSGGERQRIGLARAFLYDSPLMILDEPTSNLDSLNESIILRAIQEQKNEKTVILVSHRASTLSIVDQLYQLNGGESC